MQAAEEAAQCKHHGQPVLCFPSLTLSEKQCIHVLGPEAKQWEDTGGYSAALGSFRQQ